MRQPRLVGPNNVLLAYPRKLPSLRVDLLPLIERKVVEHSKQALPVQKFHEAWRRAVEQESFREVGADEVSDSPHDGTELVVSVPMTGLKSPEIATRESPDKAEPALVPQASTRSPETPTQRLERSQSLPQLPSPVRPSL
jgi:hypothetical protein